MKRFLSRVLAGVGILFLILGVSDCTKRVPVPDGTFEAHQNVLLTFKDGRSLKGHISPGSRVEYQEQGNIYQARVASIGEDDFQIGNLVLITRSGSRAAAVERMSDARKKIADPPADVTLSRKDLEKVELVRFDTGKSVRKSAFWTYGGALLVLLLAERS